MRRRDRDFPTQELDTQGVLRRLLSERNGRPDGREIGELRVIDHPDPRGIGKSYPLIDGLSIRIGRSELAEATFPADASMSRLHARLVSSRDGIVLEDLESTNGILVNDIPAGRVSILGDEDRIQIGQVKFRVVATGTPCPAPRQWIARLDAKLAGRREPGTDRDLRVTVVEIHATDRLESTFGRATTDEIRRWVLEEIERQIEPGSILERIGRDSLCAVLPSSAGVEDLERLTRALRRALERVAVEHDDTLLSFRCAVHSRSFRPPYPPTRELLAEVVADPPNES